MKVLDALIDAAKLLRAVPNGHDCYAFTERGVSCELQLTSDEGVVWLEVRTSVHGLGRMTFEAETGFDRLGKRLGVCREIQLGDETFDPVVYIDTAEEDALVRAYLGAHEARSAVLDIVRNGGRLELSPTGQRVALAETVDPDPIVTGARALVRFIMALPQPLPPPRKATGSRLGRLFFLMIFICVGSWIGYGLSQDVAPRSQTWPWVAGIGLNLVAVLPLVPLLALRVRKRSSGFFDLIAMVFFFQLAFMPVGTTAIILYNASHDTSPVEQPVVVASSSCSEDDYGPRTDIEVHLHRDPTDEPEVASFALPRCRVLERGAVLPLITSPGGLGFERWHGLAIP